MELSAAQRERYERNLLVEGFTDRMQQALIAARVAVVGAGGLGSAALNYLVAAGVGHLTLIENDTVSLSNLQRQVLYTTADMGRPKAEVAAMRLSRLNPGCDIRVVTDRLTAANAVGLLGGHDAVVDCTDNYDARYVIDDFCREAEVPMIYGTAEAVGGRFPCRGRGRLPGSLSRKGAAETGGGCPLADRGGNRFAAGARNGQTAVRSGRIIGRESVGCGWSDDAGQ